MASVVTNYTDTGSSWQGMGGHIVQVLLIDAYIGSSSEPFLFTTPGGFLNPFPYYIKDRLLSNGKFSSDLAL